MALGALAGTPLAVEKATVMTGANAFGVVVWLTATFAGDSMHCTDFEPSLKIITAALFLTLLHMSSLANLGEIT